MPDQPHPDEELARDDLKKERDDFLKTFFRKGVELTEELVREREAARQRVASLEEENTRLRAQLASEEAIRELFRKIELLEREKEQVLRQYREAEALSTQQSETYQEVESELANFANLYVASYQLHSSLFSPRGVIQNIKELAAQFIGAENLALYLLEGNDAPGRLVVVASEGVAENELGPVQSGQGAIGEAFANGKLVVRDGDPREGRLDTPTACIPLRLQDRVIGVLVIFRTLVQKVAFTHVDHELFKLLGAQAMTALISARLFAERGRDAALFTGFRDLGG
jgi:GAF domain-containing protein